MSCYPEPDSHTKDKVKVVLHLSNYASKKEWEHATVVDTSDFAAKLDIAKLVNVSTSLNNLKTNVNDLDVGELKTVPIDLKKLSYVVYNQVVKNPKFNTPKTKSK